MTLNRPGSLNAMNRKLSAELHHAVKAAEADDGVGCIVITGAGEKAFTAGGDINEQLEDDASRSDEELERLRDRPQSPPRGDGAIPRRSEALCRAPRDRHGAPAGAASR